MQDINNSEIKLPNLGGEMPSLTLDPFSSAAATEEPKLDVELGTSKTLESIAVDDSMLTEQEKKQVDEFSKKIDIRDNSIIMQYGAAAQQKVAN
ncbi:MAG TPA: toxic anion resistance protein, partial [Bacillota bacterium]|nr:toxic anion resistance protein [Bacillota bacterium]